MSSIMAPADTNKGELMSGGGFVIERRIGRFETVWSRVQAGVAHLLARGR
jgi:hypothetical protein